MSDFFDTVSVEGASGKWIATITLVTAVLLLRWLVVRTVSQRIDDAELVFRTRKAAVYVSTLVIVLGLGFVWLDALGDLGTFLGLLSAGIAIALADVFLDMAGWVYIILRRPFRVGDRIETTGFRGDVVDIRLMRFTMLEIGNWVDADQSTGRLVHIPNGRLFREPAANYTEGFQHVWHELPVVVTFESDWRRAEEIIRTLLSEYAESDGKHAAADVRRASKSYFIRYRDLGATVYVKVVDHGVKLTGRMLVHPKERRGVDDRFWRGLLDAFAEEPNVELAYPTQRIYWGG